MVFAPPFLSFYGFCYPVLAIKIQLTGVLLMNDILESFKPSASISEQPSDLELLERQEQLFAKLQKAKKKLKKAEKMGKAGKKHQKKIRKLKAENKRLQSLLQFAKQAPTKGQWHGLIEKSVPEVIKLVTVLADRKFLTKER